MGALFVLFSPCFRENVVVTCKIGSFLCSLDNLLQKNVIVFFFGNQISNWRSFEKKGYFWPSFHIFSYQGKVTKIPSAHISLTYIHVFCSPYWLFFALPIFKNIQIYQVWFLFGMSPGVDSCIICTILEQSINNKWWAKCKLEYLLLICVYTNAKFIVICKTRTLNDGGEDSVQYRNHKKHCFLAAAILLLIGKLSLLDSLPESFGSFALM